MRYILILLILINIQGFALADDRDLYGVYESKFLHDSFDEEFINSPERENFRDKMHQTLTIKETQIIFSIGKTEPESNEMTYTIHGNFILAKYVDGDYESFYPIYIKDNKTLFMAGQRFVKKQ